MGTSMMPAIFQFKSGEQEYRIWAWKGDYVNLGAGAELGIYKRMTVFGIDTPHWEVDKSRAMTMTLNLTDNKGNTIIDYAPTVKQWWITGFNPDPKYKNVNASDLKAIYTITFNTQTMYDDFYKTWGGDIRWTGWDRETLTARLEF
jgi:hypothetical protein